MRFVANVTIAFIPLGIIVAVIAGMLELFVGGLVWNLLLASATGASFLGMSVVLFAAYRGGIVSKN